MIKGCRRMTYEQRLDNLNLTTLEERHHRADMIRVYNILTDKFSTYTADFLRLNNRPGRRNSMKLYKKGIDLNYASKVLHPG